MTKGEKRKSAPLTNRGAPLVLDNRTARRLLLDRYALAANPRRALDRRTLLDLIETLGYVQIDSISTVERAHHMILSSRADGYRHEDLRCLTEDDRELFENWTHDAVFLPTRFYPYWRARFALHKPNLLERWRNWGRSGFEERFARILRHIRDQGPVRARDFAPKRESRAQGWWDWHPDKSALEFLWRTGDLAVARREGFQKVYDLSERVIPECHREPEIGHDELVEWACVSALERLGYGTPGEIAGFWDTIDAATVKSWIERQPSDRLQIVQVSPGCDARAKQAWALAGHIEELRDRAHDCTPPSRLRVLSPFDPLIRDRKRLAHVFGFDYRIEVFVPEAQRRYGYYVFPLLEGDRLIGRIDMRHRKDEGTLAVDKIWWEDGVRCGQGRQDRLFRELNRIRRFVDADSLVLRSETALDQ